MAFWRFTQVIWRIIRATWRFTRTIRGYIGVTQTFIRDLWRFIQNHLASHVHHLSGVIWGTQ